MKERSEGGGSQPFSPSLDVGIWAESDFRDIFFFGCSTSNLPNSVGGAVPQEGLDWHMHEGLD